MFCWKISQAEIRPIAGLKNFFFSSKVNYTVEETQKYAGILYPLNINIFFYTFGCVFKFINVLFYCFKCRMSESQTNFWAVEIEGLSLISIQNSLMIA